MKTDYIKILEDKVKALEEELVEFKSAKLKTKVMILTHFEAQKEYYKGLERMTINNINPLPDEMALDLLKKEFSSVCYKAINDSSESQNLIKEFILKEK